MSSLFSGMSFPLSVFSAGFFVSLRRALIACVVSSVASDGTRSLDSCACALAGLDGGSGGKSRVAHAVSKIDNKTAMTLVLTMILFRAFWRRRFKPEFLMAHMSAGISDVAADAESRTSDDKSCDRER